MCSTPEKQGLFVIVSQSIPIIWDASIQLAPVFATSTRCCLGPDREAGSHLTGPPTFAEKSDNAEDQRTRSVSSTGVERTPVWKGGGVQLCRGKSFEVSGALEASETAHKNGVQWPNGSGDFYFIFIAPIWN